MHRYRGQTSAYEATRYHASYVHASHSPQSSVSTIQAAGLTAVMFLVEVLHLVYCCDYERTRLG